MHARQSADVKLPFFFKHTNRVMYPWVLLVVGTRLTGCNLSYLDDSSTSN